MKPVPSTLRGIVRGSTIVLDTDPGLPEGQTVTVTVRTQVTSDDSGLRDPNRERFLDACDAARTMEPAEGLRRSFGSCADEAEDLDEFLALSRSLRKQPRREIEP